MSFSSLFHLRRPFDYIRLIEIATLIDPNAFSMAAHFGFPDWPAFEPGAGQENSQYGMEPGGRPQQAPDPLAAEPETSKIQRDKQTVNQHAGKPLACLSGWDACQAQRNQGDAGHARDGYGDAGQFLSQQQQPNERRHNQQRHPGRGFTDSSENKRPSHCEYLQSNHPLDAVLRIRL
jgi:hypothetical protein